MPLGALSSCASFWLPTKTWLSQESITKKSAVSWLQFKVSPILLGKPSNQTLTFAKHSPRKSPNHPISLQPPACNIWTDWRHRNQSAALAMGDLWGFPVAPRPPPSHHGAPTFSFSYTTHWLSIEGTRRPSASLCWKFPGKGKAFQKKKTCDETRCPVPAS